MTEFLQSFNLSVEHWILTMVCGLLIGTAKTGISGAGMVAIPILAGIFGGKISVGVVLPMLCFADIFGVTYYHRHADRSYIRRLMPWTLAGILLGLLVGNSIPDAIFKEILAFAVLASVAILFWQEYRSTGFSIPDYWWISALMGFGGGFFTMIGNAAGPLLSLYLLSMHLPKYTFIGTRAWFFLIVNFLKVPLHIYFWHTITIQSLMFDAAMIPAIVIGAFMGVEVIKKIPEKPYRLFIMMITVVAALKLFF